MTYEEARDIIAGAEKDYRELMKLHGEIFTKSESEAISLLAVQGAAITEAYLEKTTGLDLTVPPEIISVYEEFFLNYAIPAVEGDYSSEVLATLDYLKEQMLPLEVADMPSMPEFILFRNYPNPFNPSTTIEFSLNSGGYVTLDIFNISGQKINTLIAKNLSAGVHSVVWYGRDGNGSAVSSGIYFGRLRQNNHMVAHRMVLIR